MVISVLKLKQKNIKMNERIKDLLGQAYDEAVPETWTTLSSDQLGRIYEKFAELIVRECADFIKPLGDWCGGHGEPQMPSTSECAKRLKEHFGVEE